MYDLTRDGVPEILVGHGDGSVEVYVSNEVGEPQIQFKQTLPQSVTSICGGVVGCSGYGEVVVSTYAGQVIGLTTEPQVKELGPGSVAATTEITPEGQAKIEALKQEIAELQAQVKKERERYQTTSHLDTAISAVPQVRFLLPNKLQSYTNKNRIY
jgi:Bardet-Biedl syndrome 7 protein